MTHTLLRALIVTLMFFRVAPAVAQQDETGFYVGVSIGLGTSAMICEGDNIQQADCLDNGVGGKALLGYAFAPAIAAEVGVRRQTGLTRTAAIALAPRVTVNFADTFENESVMLSVLLKAPNQGNLKPFGRIGVHQFVTRRQTADPSATHFGQNGSAIFLGAGVGYSLENRNVGLRAEWERFPLPYAEWHEDDLDLLSLGVVYGF